MNYHEILKAIVFCFIIFIFVGFFWIFTQIFSNNLEQFFIWKTAYNNQSLVASLQNGASESSYPERNWQIKDIEIEASSAVSVNIANLQLAEGNSAAKILFEKNGTKKLPIASLTKLMTAVISIENYDPLQEAKISKTAAGQGGFFKAGEIFSVDTLMRVMLIGSDNDAAYALSEIMGEEKFVALMNDKAEKFGFLNTHYSDPVGSDPENYSTAEDLAKLTNKLLENYPLIFEITANQEFEVNNLDGTFHHKVINTNQLLNDSFVNWSDKITGSKTGTNEEAGECLILILKSPNNKGYLINVILNSKDRFAEIKKIIDWVYDAYEWRV